MAAFEEKIDIGRVIQRGLEALGRRFPAYALLALLLAFLPVFATRYALTEGALLTWISGALLQAAIIRSAIRDLRGEPAEIGSSLAEALKLLLRIMGIMILSAIVSLVGLLFLIVPGVIAYIVLLLSIPVLVEERRGVFGSMRRSAELAYGSWLRIFALLLLFGLFYFLVGAAAGLAGFAPSVGGGGIGGAAASGLISAVVTLTAAPMLASLYLEARAVKEGRASDSVAAVFD